MSYAGGRSDPAAPGRRPAGRQWVSWPRLVFIALILAVAVAVGLLTGALGRDAPGDAKWTTAPQGATPVPPVAPVEVWAVGDGADGSESGRRVGRMIAAAQPARMIYLGDVYPSGTRADFQLRYQPVFGALARRTLPTPGNHDWPRRTEGYHPYWLGVYGVRMPTTYSARVGGWDIFSLNSEDVGGFEGPQARWLRARVRGAGTCRLAFWHRPRFSAGKHGDSPQTEPFWRELRGHAAMVLNGHEHNMQELRVRDGIRQLISGAGGKSHYQVRPGDPRVAWSNVTDFGALRLRLRPGRADWAFVAVDGRVLRRGSTSCVPT